jgi:hypothetical protein
VALKGQQLTREEGTPRITQLWACDERTYLRDVAQILRRYEYCFRSMSCDLILLLELQGGTEEAHSVGHVTGRLDDQTRGSTRVQERGKYRNAANTYEHGKYMPTFLFLRFIYGNYLYVIEIKIINIIVQRLRIMKCHQVTSFTYVYRSAHKTFTLQYNYHYRL